MNGETEESVSWTSSAPAVATVTDGKVTAVAKGSATINAMVENVSDTCMVTVTEKPAVTGVQMVMSHETLLIYSWGSRTGRRGSLG